MADELGMGKAVKMLFNSLTAKPCIKGQTHVKFDSVRQARATYTLLWESSPTGIREGSTFVLGALKVTVTSCQTQQIWFDMFLRGMENWMGYVSQWNQPLCGGMMQSLLDTVKEEIQEVDEVWLKNEYIKFGAAAALVVCGSLRGPEVFLIDLTGLRKYITLGRDGVLPDDPLKPGADFINYPYIIVTLIGEFKGELGTKHHLIALASCTSSGIELRWWLEELLRVQETERCRSGPAFGHQDGSVALMSEYDDLLTSSLGE